MQWINNPSSLDRRLEGVRNIQSRHSEPNSCTDAGHGNDGDEDVEVGDHESDPGGQEGRVAEESELMFC